MQGTPLERAAAGDVRLRRWGAEDAEALHELVLANLEHLRPWMSWIAAEPVTLDGRRAKVAEWDAAWEAGEEFAFAIVDAGGELLGACGLHRTDDPSGLAIGYWVRRDRIRQGIATDAVRALLAAIRPVGGLTHVEIHHDAANAASRRVPEKLGFTCVQERPEVVVAPGQAGIDVTWRLGVAPS